MRATPPVAMQLRQWLFEAVISLAAVWLCLSKPTDKRSILLPASLLPEHYEISLVPWVDKGVFHGVVVISGVALVDTDRIVLHCKSLLFNTTSLTDLTTDEQLVVEDIEEDLLLQQCHLFLNQSIRIDHEYRLSVEFMGYIGKDGYGLYRDFYKENGHIRDILMTHFQPNFARTVFPCFDEPHYKAQFLLRVSRQHFLTVLSNMPVSAVFPPDPEENNRTWVEFEETPPMSTYLLVLVMCDYLALTDSTTNISVWAPRSRLHEAQLALNISVAVLGQCERYFSTEYPLPKLDHVPVPTLNTIAMENWGTITYKKEFLLWEEGVSTSAQKETITQVVAHEIVHQWLGNLVTTAWWNTTWLNEGVTSFYHYYIMDKVEPSWNVMDNMFVPQIQMILNEEATRDPKPLTNNEALSQEAISTSAFSASTYLKGAAVVRMVHNSMAPDIFREAMVQYIIDNEYGSVDEEDLWQSLAAVADLPVDLESVMYSWTHQPGFPLVTVIRDAGGCIHVSQMKYLAKDQSDACWTIPLTYTTSSEPDFNFSSTVWFPEDLTEMPLEECLEPTDWIIVNIRQSGFYRVNYDPLTWRALTHDLQNCDLSDIHSVNRGQLLHDGFDLAYHGLLEYPVILELARYLTRETEYLPWSVAIYWLNSLRTSLYTTETSLPFQHYALSLVEEVFSRMPLTGTTAGMIQELHRKQVVDFACRLGHPRCVKAATDTAYLLMSGVDVKIPLDLKPVLLCAAVKYGQDEVWHFVLKEYLEAAENERWKYLVALACSSKRDTIERLLKDVASPKSFVKSTEERLNLLVEVGRQDDYLELILDMILEKFHILSLNFDFEVILHIIRSLLTPSLSQEERQKIDIIMALVGKSQNTKQIELLESIDAEINRPDFKFMHENSIKEWLRQGFKENEEEWPTPIPTSLAEHPFAATTTTDMEDVQPTLQASVDEVPSEEYSEEVVEKDDSGGVSGTGAPATEASGDTSTRNSINVLSFLVMTLLCVIR